MKHFLIVCFLLLMVQPVRAQGDPNRDTHWREDVDYVWQQIQRVHPDPFRSTPQTIFAQMVSDLDIQIPNLSDAQIVVRLFALVAALHDGHSFFWFTQNAYPFQYYPLMFYPFSDGVYLVEAAPPYANLVGDRLDKIGTTDTAQVLQTLIPLTPRDNQYSGLVTIPILLSMSDALLGAGLITDANQPAYLLEGTDGKPITINPAPVGLTQYQAAIPIPVQLPSRAGVLSLSHLDQSFWSTTLPEGHTLYIQYNAVQREDSTSGKTLADFARDLDTIIAAGSNKRVILDMRYNEGGDINTAVPLRTFFSSHDLLKTPGNLIVLIGRNTFSAAVVFTLWLEQDEHAIFIGEPTGGKPLMFENGDQFTLPNSHLSLQIASRARQDVPASDTRTALVPQVAISLSSADYFGDLDPVLAAALAY